MTAAAALLACDPNLAPLRGHALSASGPLRPTLKPTTPQAGSPAGGQGGGIHTILAIRLAQALLYCLASVRRPIERLGNVGSGQELEGAALGVPVPLLA